MKEMWTLFKRLVSITLLLPLLMLQLSWETIRRILGRRDLDPAFVSASFQIGGKPPLRLKPDSADALSLWLTRQARGWWSYRFAPAPLRCNGWVSLIYQDGKTVSLQIHPRSVITYGARKKKGLLVKAMEPAALVELLSFFGPQ